jgi:hypothetical protein
VALLHGTAMLLHAEDVEEEISRNFRRACITACEVLIRAAPSRTVRSRPAAAARGRKSISHPKRA